jgi:hypothetical protein
MTSDGRLMVAKGVPLVELVDRLGIAGLRAAGAEKVGPCPVCGGRDRFSIRPGKGVWNCRHCGGGDGVALVRHVMGLDFPAALDWIVGAETLTLSPEELRRREAEQRKAAEARRAEEDRRRAQAIARARRIWQEGVPVEGTPVAAYLAGRGFTPERMPRIPAVLRAHPALPYMVEVERGRWVEIHRGPAMLAAVQRADGRFGAVHRTWIDPDRPGKKMALRHGGEDLPAKKVEGSKKGGAIRLSHHGMGDRFDTLVMGEGIETTLSARVSVPIAGAAWWAGVDLGNMSGSRITTRERARMLGLPDEGIRTAGFPDMSDGRAFVPPPWVRRLLFLMDGDSDPAVTRAHLLSGLRRAAALIPGLEAQIVAAPRGADFNDVLRGEAEFERVE